MDNFSATFRIWTPCTRDTHPQQIHYYSNRKTFWPIQGHLYLFLQTWKDLMVCNRCPLCAPPFASCNSLGHYGRGPGRQCHGGLFLKDANKKMRLGLFNASLGFSLCPHRQAGRPFRQPLPCGAWLCRSLTLNCRSIVLRHTCADF